MLRSRAKKKAGALANAIASLAGLPQAPRNPGVISPWFGVGKKGPVPPNAIPMVLQMPKQGVKKRIRRKRDNNIGLPGNGARSGGKAQMDIIPAPTSFGICMTSLMSLRMSGRPQMVDEYEPGVRVVGNTFFHFDTADATVAGAPTGVLLTTPAVNMNNLFISNGVQELSYCRRLTPQAFGNRLGTIAAGFRFYAIRRLTLRWVPIVPTSTFGNVAVAVIRDGSVVTRNSLATSDALTTPEGMVSCIPSFMTPIWEPCALQYFYRGSKVWSVWPVNGTADSHEILSHVQGAIGVIGSGLAVNSAYGRLALEYVVDLYEPGPILTGANLQSTLPSSTPQLCSKVSEEKIDEPVVVQMRSKSEPRSGTPKPVLIR